MSAQEEVDVAYKSTHAGRMHACGSYPACHGSAAKHVIYSKTWKFRHMIHQLREAEKQHHQIVCVAAAHGLQAQEGALVAAQMGQSLIGIWDTDHA